MLLSEYQGAHREFQRLNDRFYAARAVDPDLKTLRKASTIRKILKSMFEGTGTDPNVLWTWHPDIPASMVKTKIVYEAYPTSQDEVDAMVAKLHLAALSTIRNPRQAA